MRLLRIEIDNFMPFGEGLSWEVPQAESLLMLIEGEYVGKEKSNGAGKSSLFEAVYWALTGEVVRKVKAAQVIRTNAKSCRVSIVFEIRGEKYKVTRTRTQGQSIGVEFLNMETGEVIPCHTASEGTAAIMETLGLSVDLLALVSFFGKGFITFSRMEPKDRAELVAKIAKSDLWEAARVEASDRVKKINRNLGIQEALKETTLDTITELTSEIEQLERELKDKEQELSKKRDQYKEELDQIGGFLDDKILDRNELISEEEIYTRRRDAFNKLNVETHEGLATLAGTIQGAQTQLNDLTKGIKGNKCPTCGQVIKRTKQVKEKIVSITKQLEDLTVMKDDLAEESVILDEQLAKVNDILETTNSKIQQYNGEIRQYENTISNITHLIETLDLDVVRAGLTEKLSLLRDKQLVDKQATVVKIQEELDRLGRLLVVDNFWTTGFKRIRLQSMRQVVQCLEQYINNFAMRLGLIADRVYMDVKAELSGKGFKPEITLGVIRGENRLVFNQLSTGEVQCLDFACFLASSMWLQQVYGLELGFCVWDEPLEGLDADSKYRAFQLLKEVKRSQKFVIDHDAHFRDQFDYTKCVVKGEDGISRF